MKAGISYIPSKLLVGETEVLRQHSFTRWMSRDLIISRQRRNPAGDCWLGSRNARSNEAFLPGLRVRNCSPDHLTRYLFWRPPPGALVEVRSGRTLKNKFEEYPLASPK